MFQISVLGPVEVRSEDRLIAVPGGKTSELLVRLALDSGRFVSSDRLVEDLWAADAVNTARNTLQSKVSRLRRAFGDPQVIASSGSAYKLDVDPPQVDALAVLSEASAAARLLDVGDPVGAADLSTSALSRFRGDVLHAAGEGEWISSHRTRLVEARMELVETQLDARLQLGDVGEVIGDLESAVATYEFRERLWELLITALYGAGRQADALAAYRRIRTQLAEELGLEPGPRLQQLEVKVLAHDSSLSDAEDVVAGFRPGAMAGNLPSLRTELVGREAEIGAVAHLLEEHRLVEIVGPGGVGKTALAIATGRRLTESRPALGGIWLVRLESATTPDDVIDTLIAALNVTGDEAALIERLRSTSSTVILDNCEHVLDAVAELSARLLDAASGLRILCTTQVPLEVEGEATFELAPLALDDAVELFTARAERIDGSSRKADEGLHELCRSLDGLPLAIELAAARTKTLSIEEITRRLDDRFAVLSDPASRRPQRRRALKATIGWSYELLFPDDKRGLWALAAFSGGAPLPAVEFALEALDVPASAAIDVVGRLAARSLVIVDGEEAPGPTRYRLLDSIRAFALEAMGEAGLTERALAAHAAWFAGEAEGSTEGVRSGRQAEHLAFARVERANIDSALAWSATHDPRLGLAIANGFGWAWIVLGDSRGAQRILEALNMAGEAVPIEDRANALLLAGWIEASSGHLELATDHIAAATAGADAIGDVDLQARCCYYLAYVVSHQGEFAKALELTDRSDVLYDGLDRPWDQAANWLFASRAAISALDHERAAEARDQVQHWLLTVKDPWLHVRCEAMLGELARIELRFDDAVAHIGRAADTSRRLGFLQTEAYQLSSLGRAQCQAGDYEGGAATLELAIEKAEATGDVRMAALARVHLGRVLRAIGRPAAARAALEAASEWHRAAGGGEQKALGECLLAALDAADELAGAEGRLDSILSEARLREDAPVEVFALDALARIAAESGDVTRARTLSETASERMESASHFITELDRVDARVHVNPTNAPRAG